MTSAVTVLLVLLFSLSKATLVSTMLSFALYTGVVMLLPLGGFVWRLLKPYQ